MSRSLLIGTMIGEYRLVDFLGAGGMGDVFRGVHAKIGRTAAIKFLNDSAHGPDFVERFFNEARLQASLQHPNIATLYDFLESQGKSCIIMEYVDGLLLTDYIKLSGSLPLHETVRIFKDVAGAIGYIHRHEIIHRDIKSSNIKIGSTGAVKLLDFGIAKGRSSLHLTQSGGVLGTPYYLSPEQLTGAATASVRTDIWALGVLLYEMLTGQLPFSSQTLGELCVKVASGDYPQPAQLNHSIPPEASDIINRCLQKDPARRYESAEELLLDVAKLESPRPHERGETATGVSADGPGTRGATASLMQNWKLIAGGAGLLGVLALVLAAGAIFFTLRGADVSGPAADTGKMAVTAVDREGAARAAGPPNTILIDVDEGQAEVYRDAMKIGTTPCNLQARVNERLNLTLRREGYHDKNISLDVGPNKKVYTYSMLQQK